MKYRRLENVRLCECGCGQIVQGYNCNGQAKRFVHGHNQRGADRTNHPCYRGGKCKKNQAWRDSIKERDNYVCQRCGVDKLEANNCHAHHVKSREDYPELVYDKNNGVTLCSACHAFVHGTGRIFSEETRRKLSVSNTGHIVTEETRRKLSGIFKGRSNYKIIGRKHTKEEKEKISKARKGIPWTFARREAQQRKNGEYNEVS